jgi:sortase A
MPEGELVARLTISRLKVDSPVLEGVGVATLARGAGHVPQTAFPGDETTSGPSVIAIPRGRLGEAVGRMRLGDRVRLTTPSGQLGYRVVERRIHEPSEFHVDSAPEGRVTLLTPFPPDSPGPAPMRLAVVLQGAD